MRHDVHLNYTHVSVHSLKGRTVIVEPEKVRGSCVIDSRAWGKFSTVNAADSTGQDARHSDLGKTLVDRANVPTWGGFWEVRLGSGEGAHRRWDRRWGSQCLRSSMMFIPSLPRPS